MERARNRDTQWLGYTEWLTPPRVAAELGVEYKRVLEWIGREEDPLPAVLIDGNRKKKHVRREELNSWLIRHSASAN